VPPGLLHAHFGWTGADCALAARKLALPFLVSFHGTDLTVITQDPHWLPYYSTLLADTDGVTVVSRFLEDRLRRIGYEGQIDLIPSGVRLSAFPFRGTPRPRSAPALLFVGRLVPGKGVDVLLRAVHRVRAGGLDMTLRVIGDGPVRAELESSARAEGLAEAVRFLGTRSHQQVREELERSDIVVIPSQVMPDGLEEGSSVVSKEAQAVGVPVVATRVGGIPETFPPDLRHELVAPGSDEALAAGIVRVWCERERWPTRVKLQRDWIAAEFAWDQIARRLAEVYRRLLAEHPPGRAVGQRAMRRRPGRDTRLDTAARAMRADRGDGSRGVLTTAFGPRRYRDLAVALARSLDRHCPELPRAVVTDVADARLDQLYDRQVPLRPERGSGLLQKLWLVEYSPFEETLFIDADALVMRDLGFLWDLLGSNAVSAVGHNHLTRGVWFGDIAERCARFDLPAVPVFNGGLYYFRRGEAAERIFGDARLLAQRYDAHGFTRMSSGSANEEVLLSVAIARATEGGMVNDDGRAMRTPLGIVGPLRIDVLRGIGRFNKYGRPVEPAVIHFCGDWAQAAPYRRERMKLGLSAAGMPDRIVSPSLDLVWSLPNLTARVRRWVRR
jgi:glycosyltransferase involved in cell wall biosynthesis